MWSPHRPTLQSRCFINPFATTTTTNNTPNDVKKLPPLLTSQEIQTMTNSYFQRIEHRFLQSPSKVNHDSTLYTGGPGVALAFWLYSRSSQSNNDEKRHRENVGRQLLMNNDHHHVQWLENAYRQSQRDVPLQTSLLCGLSGNIFVELLYARDGPTQIQLLDRYVNHIRVEECDADEWLYGRTGYLWGLIQIYLMGKQLLQQPSSASKTSNPYFMLFDEKLLQCHRTKDTFQSLMTTQTQTKLRQVLHQMLIRGKQYDKLKSKNDDNIPKLLYQWYNDEYLGSAHGLAGIYYMMLSCCDVLGYFDETDDVDVDDDDLELIIPSANWLLFQMNCGEERNFPAVRNETEAYLMHFCHGAPGFVFLACKLYWIALKIEKKSSADSSSHKKTKRWNDLKSSSDYLKEAERLGHLVWQYGLLKKGIGLCHGVAGNSHVFLTLMHCYDSRGEDDAKQQRRLLWEKRAHYFARQLDEVEKNAPRRPDRPYSLFEGIAGTGCFLLELLGGDAARGLVSFEVVND